MNSDMTTRTDPPLQGDYLDVEAIDPDVVQASPLHLSPARNPERDGEPVLWEYRTAFGGSNSADAERELNVLGLEGWELVAVVPPHDPSGQTVLYLKRVRRV
jgi:hypothetical protein